MDLRLFFVLTCIAVSQSKLLESTCSLIKKYVDGHNSRRLLLAKGQVPGQPAAAEMKYLVWDEELAGKAAQWASKNKFSHNPDKFVPSQRWRTGENLYWYATTDASFVLEPDVGINSWFTEYMDYNYEELRLVGRGKKKTGHYTQMIWSNSTYVGCATSQYKENGYNTFLLVCNYGPTGNYVGQYPYKAGEPSNSLTCGVDHSECGHFYGERC